MVVFEPFLRPEAEIPFPNDAATRLTSDSPTGRRLNVATEMPLEVEALFRRQLNRLDGFSVIAPITVAFDAPIDLDTVSADSVLLFDVSEGSPDFGRPQHLDLGSGAYPVAGKVRPVYPGDPSAKLPDLLFGEDNVVDGERLEHYEVATNTLIIRPTFPLRQETTYAVVLTRALKGRDGEPVRSPFDGVNEPSQTHALAPVPGLVKGGADSVAFAWTFTTQSLTRDWSALRRGMDGEGPLAWLAEDYPPLITDLTDFTELPPLPGETPPEPDGRADGPFVLDAAYLNKILTLAEPFIPGGVALEPMQSVDYVVLGSIRSLDFRRPDDGAIWVDEAAGTVDAVPFDLPFLLAIPIETEEHKPPFKVVIHSHATRTSRLEAALIAEHYARRGFAALSIDAAGHGPITGDVLAQFELGNVFSPSQISFLAGAVGKFLLGPDYDARGKSLEEILADFDGNPVWRVVATEGRSVDDDGDGLLQSGDGYLVPNSFRLGASGRQTVLDNMMAMRLLLSFDQDALPDGFDDLSGVSTGEIRERALLGDFNADGRLDVGGAGAEFSATGISLGGFHTALMMAVEPNVTTAVPIVSGGNLSDLMVRTSLTDATDPIFAQAYGPAVVGCPTETEDGEPSVALTWNFWSQRCRDDTLVEHAREQGGLPYVPVVPGGTAVLENPRLRKERGAAYAEDARHESPVNEQGGFQVSVASDVGDTLALTLLDAGGEQAHRVELSAVKPGLGRLRNTPRFRRLIDLAQIATDRTDPSAYARHLFKEPLDGAPPKNILHVIAVGDRIVPFSVSLSFDRAAGLFGLDEADALGRTQAFIDHDAVAGLSGPYWDVDGWLGGEDHIGPLPPIETASGKSAVRFAATNNHEYITTKGERDGLDWGTFHRNMYFRYLESGGAEIIDDLCLLDDSCDGAK